MTYFIQADLQTHFFAQISWNSFFVFYIAVLAALQNLQEKIGTLEVDRVKAETNLRSLTAETSEYKELLKQKFDNTSSSLGSHDTTKRDSQSEGTNIWNRLMHFTFTSFTS